MEQLAASNKTELHSKIYFSSALHENISIKTETLDQIAFSQIFMYLLIIFIL